MTKDYETTILRSGVDLEGVAEEWRAFLAERAEPHVLAQHPDLVQLYLNQEGKNRTPRIVIVRRESAIQCVAPCYVERERFRLRLSVLRLPSPRARLLKLFGDSIVLARGADARGCLDAVWGALKTEKTGFDLAEIQNLAVPSPLWDYFHTPANGKRPAFLLFRVSPKMEKVRQLVLPESHQAWRRSLSGKTRQRLNYRIRRFKKEMGGEVELVRVADPDQVKEFLDQVDRIFKVTWQAKTLGHWARNTPAEVAHFQQIAANGWLRSYLLLARKRAVAFLIGYQYAGRYEHSDPGYDPGLSRIGPGSVLNYLAIEDLFEHDPPRVLDFGFGENEYKRVLGNAEHEACSVYLVPPNRWRAAVMAQLGLNSVYRLSRGALERLRLDRIFRRLLKRK